MARFHTLTVTQVRKTIRDAVEITLEPDRPEKFDFTAGQYLTFRQEIEGVEVRRNYSICTAPGDALKVGVKRVEGGAFSTFANEGLRIGDRLDAMSPQGRFAVQPPKPAGQFLGFAGGSGITPILSLIRTTLASDPNAAFTLIYANRSAATIMFREELEDLKNSYMGRLGVIHILETDAQDIDLFTGRLTPEKCTQLFKKWVNVRDAVTAYICGPEPMMQTVSDALENAGLPKSAIRMELFTSPQLGRLAQRQNRTEAADQKPVTAEITLDGATRTIEMAPDMSVLTAALANSLDAPYACRAGVCSTCKCRVIEGEVEMVANHALEDYEVARGFVLSCQSFPVSEKLIIDYDVRD